MNPEEQIKKFGEVYNALREEIGKVIVGQKAIVEGTLNALFANGHVLLEGVPGLGKTLLVRTLSQVLDLSFNRIQFTPDLMPADVLGTNMVHETDDGKRAFEFQHGPIFELQQLVQQVPVASHVKDYAIRLILATHPNTETALDITNQFLRFGSSPRGAQALLLGAKVRALTEGRFNVSFDDVAVVAPPALRHRLIVNFEAEAEGVTTDIVLDKIMAGVPFDADAAKVSS